MMYFSLSVSFIALLVQYVQSCDLSDSNLNKWAKKRVETLGGCVTLSGGAKPVHYKVPNVKLFVYHNDEHEVIADFLQYHSYVFGAEKIVVIDQNSRLESVCKTLALFQHCGTTVITTQGSFLDKSTVLSEEMRQHYNTLLIPLDTDEFIFPHASAQRLSHAVDVNRDALWQAFKALPIDGRKYKFQYYTCAKPNASVCLSSYASAEPEFRRVVQNDAYFPMFASTPRTKTFFHSHGFMSTDDGNHFGEVKNDKGKINLHPAVAKHYKRYFVDLKAQMVHFPIGGYRGARDKYVRASVNMGYTGDTDCSINRVGIQYCIPSKLFINGTDHGAKFYSDDCMPHPSSFQYQVVSDWFKKNTLSILQLTDMNRVG